MTQDQGIRRAKIVGTVGPASWEPDLFARLVEAGLDAARINFSHASHADAHRVLSMARDMAREHDRPIAVIADLQGPKLRVGDLPRPLEVAEGERYLFVPDRSLHLDGGSREGAGAGDPAADTGAERNPSFTGGGHAPGGGSAALLAGGDPRVIPCTYHELAGDLSPGDTILLDDGRLAFRVERIDGDHIVARALNGGPLGAQKGMNLPGVEVRAPSLTAKDLEDLRFACAHHVDYVALSFVRRPEDISALRAAAAPGTLIIAKIEKDAAVRHLPEIMLRADGVMVARGDLGVELPYEEVPLVQKRILRLGQELVRVSITATQMLESMTRAPRPTRAEVSDVANALLDGTDAVMLSAETATGAYPVQALETMDRVIRRIERERWYLRDATAAGARLDRAAVQQTTAGAIGAAALQAIARLGSRFMVTFTRSGFTARVVSAQRPPVPILAVTDQWRTYNQLALVWGVVPILFRGEVAYDSMLEVAKRRAVEAGLGQPGEPFVVTAGVPFHVTGTTNMIRVEEV